MVHVWRGIAGLILGVFASLLVGCGYAFMVWKTGPYDLAPVLFGLLLLYGVAFLAVVLARKQLSRLGWTGLFASLAGAAILPAANALTMPALRRAAEASQRQSRAATLDRLAAMGSALRTADVVLMEGFGGRCSPTWTGSLPICRATSGGRS